MATPSAPPWRTTAPTPPANEEPSLEYRAAKAVVAAMDTNPAGSHHWASTFDGVELYFQGRDNMERTMCPSYISFLNLIALVETEEGYGSDDYMYYVKDQGIGMTGLFLLDSQDAVEEMIDHSDYTILNVIVAKANDRDDGFNMDAHFL
ncbi:hypothetical protein D1007_45771 [Hordeum vulgare]|nr:hypothetical protein D1007_45771 [Hordeum vulgare]